MIPVRFILFYFIVLPAGLRAQPDTLAAMLLEPVEVDGQRLSPFAIGARSYRPDTVQLPAEALPTLAQVVTTFTPAAVKSYGNGMLATVSLRGTGPSHTAVLWHGINISYPMLGQNDLAVLPLALNDQISLQHGTGSALFGTGAIGGVINLGNQRPARGIRLGFSQWGGSFGTWRSRLSASCRQEQWEVAVKAFRAHSDNTFSFRNTTRPGKPLETQQGAAYRLGGVDIAAATRLSNRLQLALTAQYVDTWRQLQPPMNATPVRPDIQTDTNLRSRLQLSYDDNRTHWQITYAWLHDDIGYNGQNTRAAQQVLQASNRWELTRTWMLEVAADYRYIRVNTPFYAGQAATEQRGGLTTALRGRILPRLLTSLSLRQAFITGYRVPLAPSLGLEYLLASGPAHTLWLKSRLARGYRVPTLNERYWQPGGNPGLAAENAWSAEIGVAGSGHLKSRLEYELTGYRMWVDNWILWRPQGSFWAPENIRYVDVYGTEASAAYQHAAGSGQLAWRASYAFTRPVNRTGLDAYDRSVNKQLAYVPRHRGVAGVSYTRSGWLAALQAETTGTRYTTADNERELPPYTLLNLRLARTFSLKHWQLSARAHFDNLLNTRYQIIENRAMPGFGFLLGITLSYHKPLKP